MCSPPAGRARHRGRAVARYSISHRVTVPPLPWPQRMEPGQRGKTQFCEYMTAQIKCGAFDFETESTALAWNLQEFTRVADMANVKLATDQLAQIRVLTVERDTARKEPELKERELAIQAAGGSGDAEYGDRAQQHRFSNAKRRNCHHKVLVGEAGISEALSPPVDHSRDDVATNGPHSRYQMTHDAPPVAPRVDKGSRRRAASCGRYSAAW